MKPRTPEMFIEIWEASPSCKAAAAALNMTPQAAASRAWEYRKRGYGTKKFPKGRPPLDAKKLTKFTTACKGKN